MTASQLATILMAQIALTAGTVFVILTSTQDNGKAVRCILAELADHRINSYDADRDAATAAGRPFNVPRPPPAALSVSAAEACKDFM